MAIGKIWLLNFALHNICLFFIFSALVPQTKACFNGTSSRIGVVFEPYYHTEGTKANEAYTDEELTHLLLTVSKYFRRISSYANADTAEAGSRIPSLAAKLNSRHGKEIISEYAAIYQNEDEVYAIHLPNMFRLASQANAIYAGTVAGIIISSGYTGTSENRQHLIRMLEKAKSSSNSNSATSHIPLGLRSGDCAELARPILPPDREEISQILSHLDFIICEIWPQMSRDRNVQRSAQGVEREMLDIRDAFKEARIPVKLTFQTGWPSEGVSREGNKGSGESMREFWCYLETAARKHGLDIDLFTAFDEPWKKVFSATAETHYGWWLHTGGGKFEEKIKFHREKHTTQTKSMGLTIFILVTTLIIILLLCVVALHRKIQRSKEHVLSKAFVDSFIDGNESNGLDGLGGAEDFLRLPYDKRYEIRKSRFQIDRNQLLGKGAFGMVYKGRIAMPGKDQDEVAVKLTQPKMHSTENLKSLLSEIKIMIHVGQHPNVVSIVGAYTGEMRAGRIYIATEFCTIGCLESYLRNNKNAWASISANENYCNIPKEDAVDQYVNAITDESAAATNVASGRIQTQLLQWCQEIASGMEHIASKNVIHSDLATRNILLTSGLTAKITDFGLSRRLYEYTDYVKKNQEPLPWRWMALESLQSMSFSTKSDVWSYGVTLYEIFTMGDLPYPGLNWTTDFVDLLTINGLRLSKPDYASNEIYETMLQCWHLNPAARPNFEQLKHVFEDVLSTQAH